MRREGTISHFGAGTNDVEGGEDAATKKKWLRYYVDRLIAMEEETGERGMDFFLNANSYSLLNFNLLDNGCLD